eukprot:457056-Prorocentrum_minimum.AAC.5
MEIYSSARSAIHPFQEVHNRHYNPDALPVLGTKILNPKMSSQEAALDEDKTVMETGERKKGRKRAIGTKCVASITGTLGSVLRVLYSVNNHCRLPHLYACLACANSQVDREGSCSKRRSEHVLSDMLVMSGASRRRGRCSGCKSV